MTIPSGAILDGIAVAGTHWRLVSSILLVLVSSQAVLYLLLQKIFEDRFTGEEYLALSLAGWLLPASLLSLLWYLVAEIASLSFSNTAAGILMFAGLVWSLPASRRTAGTSRAVVWSLVLLAGVSLLLRLAFVARAVVPSYFDSAQHYLYIRQLLAGLGPSSTGFESLANYYHLGFHLLAAFVAAFTQAEITEVMLVLGQVILALMPFSMFFIVRHWTGSPSAAFLALALAAFGWTMPAHAVDWGKYPALASVALVPFVLALAYLSLENRKTFSAGRLLGLDLLLLAGLLVSVLYHSRSLIVYLLLAFAWLLTAVWTGMRRSVQLLLFIGILLAVPAEIYLIRSRGILVPLQDAYARSTLLVTTAVLFLSVFAWRAFPGLVFFCLLSVTLFLASLFIPLGTLIPGYANTTLLDRPYVQILLYLPLTLLGGFGLAGLERDLQGRTVRLGATRFAWGKIAGVFFILLVAVQALFQYELHPDDCCVIVSRDDLSAIDWIAQNLPADALLLVSSTDLKVLPTDQYQGSAGGDAGAWITPRTGRAVTYRRYDTDFSQQQTLDLLCQQSVDYVYVGKTGWSFDDSRMSSLPGSYRLVLDLPKAKVYEVAGCAA